MKKALLIMAAALMTMTQCRKQETTPVTPAADTIRMTITAGPGRTDINTADGSITWSAGDKLYVSDGTSWLGSLTLVGEGGSSQGTFTGSIAGIGESETTCHFFYLGHDNGMTEPAGAAAASISLAAQDGTLAGAMKYHMGYGSTDVTVEDGEYAGYVLMNTKIAIAHLNLTIDGTTAYKGAVTMGGTGISNTLSVSPDGTFSGSGEDGITIGNGGGTTGERYVTLIPTTGTDRVNVAFTSGATGSMTFLAGISANKFYGMKDAMTVELVTFSVSATTTVEFAPGNLYWDGNAFKFEENQWDYSVVESQEEPGGYSWNPDHVSHFFWSNTTDWQTSGKEPYAASYSYGTRTGDDVFFTNSSSFQVSGETAGTWRTLSNDEWNYLLNSRDNALSLRAWKELDGSTHKGLVILPDGTDASVMSSIRSTADLATHGAVFLLAAGRRYLTNVYNVGSDASCWSGTPLEGFEDYACLMRIFSGDVGTYSRERYYGYAVRLVR